MERLYDGSEAEAHKGLLPKPNRCLTAIFVDAFDVIADACSGVNHELQEAKLSSCQDQYEYARSLARLLTDAIRNAVIVAVPVTFPLFNMPGVRGRITKLLSGRGIGSIQI